MIQLPVYESTNPSQVYAIGKNLSGSDAERHFRVRTDSKLEMSLQCHVGKMTSRVLDCVH